MGSLRSAPRGLRASSGGDRPKRSRAPWPSGGEGGHLAGAPRRVPRGPWSSGGSRPARSSRRAPRG
eukprot:210474-Alexandrium_andersonii.AAC.1